MKGAESGVSVAVGRFFGPAVAANQQILTYNSKRLCSDPFGHGLSYFSVLRHETFRRARIGLDTSANVSTET